MLRPKHMFPSLATMKTMLTRFPEAARVLTTTKMADCEEIEAGHAQKQGKGERIWKDEEIEILITLFFEDLKRRRKELTSIHI